MRTHTFVPMIPALAALTVPAAAQFTVTPLPSFGPAVTQRMNASGQIAGDYQLAAHTTAMRYTPGVGIQARSVPAGTSLSYAYGINDGGACIGRISPSGGGTTYTVIWDANNVMTALPMPPGTWSYNTGADLNNSNMVCGMATQAIVGPDPQGAWRWTAANGYTMLPQLNGSYSFARDINNNGVICGYSGPSEDGPVHAVIWNADDTITDLGLVGTATQTFARAINDAGVVVGDSNNGTPWRYTPGVGMVALPRLVSNRPAGAYGVNSSGWIFGVSADSSFENKPVVWSPNGTLYNIEAFAGPNYYFSGGGVDYPMAIGDNNDIVSYGYDFTVSGDPRAVRFHFNLAVACPQDTNGDHNVNVNDLLTVIGSWGPCQPAPAACPADVTHDSTVNVNDLLAVIGAWGACP